MVVRLYPQVAPVTARADWAERRTAALRAAPSLALILGVFVGLYSGVFTINEAASTAAVLALVFALARRRMSWAGLVRGMYEAAVVTAMLYLIVMAAPIFTYFLTLAHVPEALVEWVTSYNAPPAAFILILMIVYLFLGAFFEEMSSIIITLPLVLPIVVGLGYDPLWWGVLCLIQIELGLIVPPIGLIVFLLHAMAPKISIVAIYRGVTPFIVADIAVLLILIAAPEVALFLPRWLAG